MAAHGDNISITHVKPGEHLRALKSLNIRQQRFLIDAAVTGQERPAVRGQHLQHTKRPDLPKALLDEIWRQEAGRKNGPTCRRHY